MFIYQLFNQIVLYSILKSKKLGNVNDIETGKAR